MGETPQESVTQTVVSSASTENKQDIQTTPNDTDKYRKDMFKFKDENRELKDRLRELELNDEQKKGNLEGVISSLKDEIKTLRGSNASDKYNFSRTNLDNAIRQEVLSNGVSSEKADVFLKLLGDDDKGAVELDGSFNVNKDDIKNLVNKQLERYSSFEWRDKKVNIVDATPSYNNPNESKKVVDIDSMSWEEAAAYAKTLKK